jgi:hypothetical protein
MSDSVRVRLGPRHFIEKDAAYAVNERIDSSFARSEF